MQHVGTIMRKRITWLASNAVFLALLFVAIVHDVGWLSLLVITFVWLMLASYAAVCLDEAFVEKYRNGPTPVPAWLSWLVDVMAAGIMIWAGWFITALAYIISCVFLSYVDGRRE